LIFRRTTALLFIITADSCNHYVIVQSTTGHRNLYFHICSSSQAMGRCVALLCLVMVGTDVINRRDP